jgi:tetratricopeptide (TPR) repeat protein
LAYASAEQLLERAVGLRRTMDSGPADRVAEVRAITQLVAVIGARHGRVALLGSPVIARGKQIAEETGQTQELLSLLWDEWAGLDIANRYAEADPIAEKLLRLGLSRADPTGLVLGHTASGISCWHRGEITESAAHLDQAAEAAQHVDPGLLSSTLLGSEQVRLSVPFSLYIHDLIGDVDEVEARFDDAVQLAPGDRYWELLVRNFAASGALSVGDFERAIRACLQGIAADPEGVSAFWSMAQRCYYGAALLMAGDLDNGLGKFEPAWAAYRAAGIRTNGASWTAIRTEALARGGRVDEAARSLAEAQNELRTYREHYAESTVLVAEAGLARARGADPAPALRRALAVAVRQGAGAMAARVRREATIMGAELTRSQIEPDREEGAA